MLAVENHENADDWCDELSNHVTVLHCMACHPRLPRPNGPHQEPDYSTIRADCSKEIRLFSLSVYCLSKKPDYD
jgi:hypothetical protein